MEWFIAVLAVAALGVAAMAAAGGMGQMSRDPVHDTFRAALPDHPLTSGDLHSMRFGLALRGYVMAQVDDLLDRLGREIEARDVRIAQLSAPPLPEPVEGPAEALVPLPEPVEGPAEALVPLPEPVEGPAEPPSASPVTQR